MLKKESRLLRVGVLGAGPISQAGHFDACRKARNVELYAICDVAQDLVTRMAAIHEPTVTYGDYDTMLADPQVEAVIVAIADQFHVSAASRAIAAGKHVLVEKPLGVTVEECEALCAQAQASGLLLQVGTMKRFDPGIAFAQRFVQEEMGQLLALKAWYCDSTYRYIMTDNLQPNPITSAHARRPAGDPKADRQRYYLLGHGSHLVDMARFLGGEIARVQARLVEKFGAYCWFVDVEFADGSVIGKTFNPWYLRSSEVECFSTRDEQYHRVLGADAHVYKLEIEGFADTILHGAPMRGADVEDGVAAIRALVAISRSVESGEWVSLADMSGSV